MQSVKNLINCQYCGNLYESAIVLPCSKNLCLKHVNVLKEDENKIMCFFCSKHHEIPFEGFPFNQTVELLIGLNFPKLEFGDKYQLANKSVKNLEEAYRELILIQREPFTYINEYFKSLQSKILVRKESLKETIDKISNKMLEDINSYEHESYRHQAKEKYEYPHTEILKIGDELKKFNSELLKLEINEEKWDKIRKRAEENFKLLIDTENVYREKLFGKHFVDFNYEECKLEKIFGKLELKFFENEP